MRHVTQSGNRRFNLFWLLPLVLLALPNCFLDASGYPVVEEEETCPDPENPECPEPPPDDVFFPGSDADDAIFCDIPMPPDEENDGCATLGETNDADNISLSEAAIALVNDVHASFALDYSDPIVCGGRAKKIRYFGEFPDGYRACINCGTQIPNPHASMIKACRAQCQDLINQNGNIPAEGAAAFCEANVTLSTNHDPDVCYPGACNDGNSNLSWVDPRKTAETVTWTDHIGTDIEGGTINDLKRTALTTGSDTIDFNAGAASVQLITKGDAWVEFSAFNATDKAHVLGVRESVDSVGDKCFDVASCEDEDPGVNNVGFAIVLNTNGSVFVFEGLNGVLGGQGPFGTFTPGERYRVNVKDNHDGTATITYYREESGVFNQFAESLTHPEYPLRVDTSFREHGAIIENATIVRIK